MSTRRTADVVFCIDASASMGPCFDAVRAHLGRFLHELRGDAQARWDVRFDFLAHSAGVGSDGQHLFRMESLRTQGPHLLQALYGPARQSGDFFTAGAEEFKRRLAEVKLGGDEATCIAIDTALDFPWRDAAACHRVLIALTDEALETGIGLRSQLDLLPALVDKLHRQHVMLFLVGPSSIAFDQLASADRSEYRVAEQARDGLATVDFTEIMQAIGKSVSVSSSQGPLDMPPAPRGLFGQAAWAEAARGEVLRGE